MTQIVFRQNGNNFMATFSGHAGAQRHNGNDLVCAAVSTLSQSLLQAMMDAKERGHVAHVKRIFMDERDGALSVDVRATKEGFPFLMGAFTTVATGCAMLAETYPDHVSLGRNFQAFSL